MKSRLKYFLLGGLFFSLVCCGKKNVEGGLLSIPSQLHIPLQDDMLDQQRVPFSIPIDNHSEKNIHLLTISTSCGCLSFESLLPLDIPAHGHRDVPFFVAHDPNLARRGGTVLLRFDNGVISKTNVALISGMSIDVSPLSGRLLTTIGKPAQFTQTVRLYAQNASNLPITTRLVGSDLPDYLSTVTVRKQSAEFVVCNVDHHFKSGFSSGVSEYDIELLVGGIVSKRSLLYVVACSPSYIPPAIIRSISSKPLLEATLIVPWLEPQKLKTINLDKAGAISSTRFDDGNLKFTFPMGSSQPGEYTQFFGKLILVDGQFSTFQLVYP